MRPVRTRLARAIARVMHFVPHCFVAIAPLMMMLEVLSLSLPDPIVRVSDYRLSTAEWASVIGFILLFAVGFLVFEVVFHDRSCPICERDKVRPRWSRWMFTVGRPWYTPYGPVWWGSLANVAVLVAAFWGHMSLLLVFWPMLAAWQLGMIAYRRAGGARSETEAKLRVAAAETGDITGALDELKGRVDQITELRKDIEKRLG